ncbi:integrase arm-type DNA-binding domain-containing protein [Halomonas saccharevitans]|uniref:Integrase arm-type DNA-binding domain-containing protein n=1 Tax=Halomonas saccharevitans TaxID=416872 RepID=A0ABU3NKQ1_9GAMM|nr:integrase arm-type DNA-binding domain-containing protein [Halomonas saccharevitans]MDT8880721.1 integrase arm-type DNA-binding domain-containing protein [Halomonas saccharevitans]
MPKKARPLSALEVKRLTTPGFHAVGDVAGLLLRVDKSGARSWILRYTTGETRLATSGKPYKVRRDHGLGGYPDTSLALAREKARKVREKLAEGIDPLAERKAAKQARLAAELARLTFKEAAEAVIKVKQAEASNPKHGAQWRQSLEAYALPTLGAMSVADIELVHVKQALEPIWQSKPTTAARVRQRIESVLSWATAHGHRAGPNPAAWKGNLDAALPAPAKIKKKAHHRAMPIDEMPAFWVRLSERDDMPAKALAFTILTGSRSGEVLGARWEEIDMAGAVWTVPPERMKGRREHRVPLSPAAVELLRSLPRSEEGLVFTRDGGRKLSDRAMTDLLDVMGEKERATVHGMRSTLRDWLSERTSTPHDVSEMILAHAIGNQAEAAYRRGDLLPKRARVMKQWAAFLATTPSASGKKVTTIRKATTE